MRPNQRFLKFTFTKRSSYSIIALSTYAVVIYGSLRVPCNGIPWILSGPRGSSNKWLFPCATVHPGGCHKSRLHKSFLLHRLPRSSRHLFPFIFSLYYEEASVLMAYLALYRKWRPRTFSEVVGKKHISCSLYKSDAAHDLLCVEIVRRHNIKKKIAGGVVIFI